VSCAVSTGAIAERLRFTVHADGSVDALVGSNQLDPATGTRQAHNWFIYDANDVLTNFS
jgi:hypothetical protein